MIIFICYISYRNIETLETYIVRACRRWHPVSMLSLTRFEVLSISYFMRRQYFFLPNSLFPGISRKELTRRLQTLMQQHIQEAVSLLSTENGSHATKLISPQVSIIYLFSITLS